MHIDIAIICATWISWCMSSGQKSEVWISDLAVLDHTHAFLNSYIVDKFLLFLQNILKGQTGPHINEAR